MKKIWINFQHVRLIALILFLGACSPDLSVQDTNHSPTISSENLKSFVTAQVVPTSQPEKYSVHFSWPNLKEEREVRIRFDKSSFVLEPGHTQFSHDIDHGKIINYTFEVLDPSYSTEYTFHKQVQIPEDFVIGIDNNILQSDLRRSFGRVYLNSKVPLITNGYHVDIKAKEFHSENGIIQTFPNNSKALLDQDGKSGGEIKIESQFAVGNLLIQMNGQHGGDGSDGKSYDLRAPQGKNATSGGSECFDRRIGFLVPSKNLLAVCFCTSRGLPGQPGHPGARGLPGSPGKNGGNTGLLQISVKEGSGLQVSIESQLGKPGTPGKGGPGQLGGLGGTGRVYDPRRDCQGEAGPAGPNGLPGPQGPDGAPGEKQPHCVQIQSSKQSYCI